MKIKLIILILFLALTYTVDAKPRLFSFSKSERQAAWYQHRVVRHQHKARRVFHKRNHANIRLQHRIIINNIKRQ